MFSSFLELDKQCQIAKLFDLNRMMIIVRPFSADWVKTSVNWSLIFSCTT